jgi:hypothetical protein
MVEPSSMTFIANPTRFDDRATSASCKRTRPSLRSESDFDRSFCDPPNDGFDFWIDSYQRALRLGGGDPLMGRKLHRYFTDAGIPTPELTAIQRVDVTGEAKLLPFSTLEATTDAIISAGIASAERIQGALEQLSDFAADSGALCGLPLDVQAWCRKAT